MITAKDISATATTVTAATTALFFSAALASAQTACESYTVKDGDTLSTIAQAAYGSYDYQIIFNANRNTVAANPNALDPGTVLVLPCEDGRLTAASAFEEIIAEQQKNEESRVKSNVYAPDIKLLAGDDWAPYTDERLKEGGFALRLATTALNRAGNSRGYNVGWVNDFDSHLYTLLPNGSFDVAVAWVVPECARNPDLMGEDSLYRCNGFYASVPVYESVVGYYTRPDSEYASAKSIADFSGATFCRMEGFFTNDLEEAGLVEPLITLIRPKSADDCIQAVLDGKADATGMAIQQATGAIASIDAGDDVALNPNFTHLSTIRFLAHKSNPWALQYIAMLDAGLNEMRETGEWYDVVSSTLAEYNDMLAGM